LVEVTCRTLQSRHLFRPSPRLNEIIIGGLARSKRMYGVRICCFAFVSNHFHLLLEVDDARQLARFMGHFTSKLAREVSRLTGWWQKIFGRRYQAILVTPEGAAQIERLTYILAHGAKEGLVDSPRQWPGAHAARALLGEEELRGYWFDRTKEYAARRRGKSFDRLEYATEEELTLDPLPCWKHLSPEERKARVASLIAKIEAQATTAREEEGIPSKGAAAILSQDPESRPRRTKKSPAPFCHAASRAWRQQLRGAYAEFVVAFRRAAEKLKAEDRNAPFPIGSFPPALPFVGG
jgi:REP element-mobilizing transposase RayT